MSFLGMLILVIGLARDAFAISICKGLSVEKIEVKHMDITGLWSGGVRAFMPLLGYWLGCK